MSDPVNQVLKYIGIVPDGAVSLRTALSGDKLTVKVESQGVVVGEKYRVAANTVGHKVLGLTSAEVPNGN